MLKPEIPVWDIILRTALIYLVLLVGFRITGKREIGQMTAFDLVVLLLIANAVQNAMVGPDTSLTGGVLAAGTLLAVNALITRLRLRWPGLRRVVEGTPTILVLHGEVLHRNLNQEGLNIEELEAALREHGLLELSKVEMAVLEVDGSISVIPEGTETRRVNRSSKSTRRSKG